MGEKFVLQTERNIRQIHFTIIFLYVFLNLLYTVRISLLFFCLCFLRYFERPYRDANLQRSRIWRLSILHYTPSHRISTASPTPQPQPPPHPQIDPVVMA